MRILHLTWEYPPLIYGGIAPHVAELSRAQAALGHDVTVVTQAHPDAPADAVVGGVRVVRVAHHPPELPFSEETLLAWVGSLNNAMAAALVLLPRPEIVHAHDWVTAYSAAVAVEGLELPLVATFHATERGRHQGHLPGALARAVDELESWLAGMSAATVACSASMARQVASQFTVRPFVIPNGVDAAAWAVRRQTDDVPLLVFAGRLEWEKGTFDLIDAMPALRRRVPGIQLLMAGRGGQADALDERIGARRVRSSVRLVGHQTHEELAQLFARAHAVVVPSRYEPFGIVALEAAAAGAPLVLADTGGLSEIGQGGAAAAMFEPGDVRGLADAVASCLRQRETTAARTAAATAALAERFAWPAIAADTVDVYARCVTAVAGPGRASAGGERNRT